MTLKTFSLNINCFLFSKRNKLRMKKIDIVLRHHFQKLAHPDRPRDVLESDDDDDDESYDKDDENDDEMSSDSSSRFSDTESGLKVEGEDADSERVCCIVVFQYCFIVVDRSPLQYERNLSVICICVALWLNGAKYAYSEI